MCSIQVQEASRISLLGRQTGQTIDHLLAGFPFAGHCALQTKDLRRVLPVALKETVEIGTGGDLPDLEPPMPLVTALGALPAGAISLWVFKKELQILIQLRLILFLAHLMLSQHDPGARLIQRKQMHGSLLGCFMTQRSSQGLAIQGDMGMLLASVLSEQPTRFRPTALFGFLVGEEMLDDTGDLLGIHMLQHITVG